MTLWVPEATLIDRLEKAQFQALHLIDENNRLYMKIHELETKERQSEEAIRKNERERIAHRLQHWEEQDVG